MGAPQLPARYLMQALTQFSGPLTFPDHGSVMEVRQAQHSLARVRHPKERKERARQIKMRLLQVGALAASVGWWVYCVTPSAPPQTVPPPNQPPTDPQPINLTILPRCPSSPSASSASSTCRPGPPRLAPRWCRSSRGRPTRRGRAWRRRRGGATGGEIWGGSRESLCCVTTVAESSHISPSSPRQNPRAGRRVDREAPP
jgi:hypothetical protein